jgi:hypothetical protein
LLLWRLFFGLEGDYHVCFARENLRGHDEALPASPWSISIGNDGTDRSALPIHGMSFIGTLQLSPEPLSLAKEEFFCALLSLKCEWIVLLERHARTADAENVSI